MPLGMGRFQKHIPFHINFLSTCLSVGLSVYLSAPWLLFQDESSQILLQHYACLPAAMVLDKMVRDSSLLET